MNPSILFFDVRDSGFVPLVEAVARAGVEPIVTHPELLDQLRERGVRAELWDRSLPDSGRERNEAELTRITDGLASVLMREDVQRTFVSRYGNFLSHTGHEFFNALLSLASNEILTIDGFESLLLRRDVRLIVLGRDNGHVERALIGAARRRSIPTLRLPQGIYSGHPTRIAGEIGTLFSDHAAVCGSRESSLMEELGTEAGRCIVTGAPLWDRLYADRTRISQADARRELGLDPSRRVVLFLPEHTESASAHFVAASARSIQIHRNVCRAIAGSDPMPQLLIRPHPNEVRAPGLQAGSHASLEEAYARWSRGLGVPDVRLLTGSMSEAVLASDLSIVEGESTLIPEVMILQRPVLMIPRLAPEGAYRAGDGLTITSDAQLQTDLAALLQNPELRVRKVTEQNTALPCLNHENDGQATRRTARAILELARVARGYVQTSARPSGPARGAQSSRRVLMVYRSDVDPSGGAALVLTQTARALKELGVAVDLSYETLPSVTGYDLVHVFNAWHPVKALEQLRHLGRQSIPIVWSPIYLNWTEYAWSHRAIRAVFDTTLDDKKREEYLAAFSAGTLTVDDVQRWGPNEVYPGFHSHLREMLSIVDHVCVTGFHEIRALLQITGCNYKKFSVVPHGVDSSEILQATPDLFRSQFDLDDFVLCIAAVDARKNQLMLVEALRDTGLTLVLIGPCFEQDYLSLCLHHGGDRVIHTGRLPRDIAASALKAARVHVLPSFAEGAALANLEAAVARCPMVVSNRSSEVEYFGDVPQYCDPADPESIRTATLAALASAEARDAEREGLGRHVEQTYSWSRAAKLSIEAYDRVLGLDRSQLPANDP